MAYPSLSLVCSLVYFTIFTLNGSLLDGSSYKDTESEQALLTMCNQDASELSAWEQYQCEFMKTRDGYKKCWPQRRMSQCAPGELKGVIFFYHGFSACPDAYNAIATDLQSSSECWHVYQLTTIGHGFKYCGDTLDHNITMDSSCTAGKYNQSELPHERQPYIDFVNRMNSIIEEEVSIIKETEESADSDFDADNLEVAVSGLSFGAPLATASVVLYGTPNIFSKLVIMSPFFGVAYKGIDDVLDKCLEKTDDWHECLPKFFTSTGFQISEDAAQSLSEMVDGSLAYFVDVSKIDTSYATFNLLIRKMISWAVEKPELITDTTVATKVDTALDHVIGWGEKCYMDSWPESDGGLDRGGFCKFAVRKLAAAHSFAQYITQQYVRSHAMDPSVETLAIMVERDGKTGASLTNNFIHLYYRDNSSAIREQTNSCMWLISEECQSKDYEGEVDNTCAVPHAFIAEKDNLLIPPYECYWEEDANGGIIDWLNDREISNDNFIVTDKWDGSRNQCVHIDLLNPASSLVGATPSLMKVKFIAELTENMENHLLDYMANLTGTPRGVLELTYDVLMNETNAGTITTVSMLLSENAAELLQTLLDHEGINDLGDVETPNITVNGEPYVLASFDAKVPNASCTEEDHTGESIVFMIIGVLVGAVLMAGISAIVVKSKGYELVPTDDKKYNLLEKDVDDL